ncbi:MAG: ATP synthase subunit delta [Bacteroidia bacterium]|nr:MAG: ATP synthase subunit delta [Bacteroidia bacterium]
MRTYRVARRYAEALMTAAEEQKVLNEVAADLESLERLLKESREFGLFLRSPVITTEKKRAVLRELFQKRMSPLTANFLDLMAEKGREALLQDVLQQFFVLRDEQLGIVPVEIRTAVEMSEDQREKIRRKFEQITRKNVRLAFSLDKQVKGGFVARIGDTMFDASVRHQLEVLRKKFSQGNGVN